MSWSMYLRAISTQQIPYQTPSWTVGTKPDDEKEHQQQSITVNPFPFYIIHSQIINSTTNIKQISMQQYQNFWAFLVSLQYFHNSNTRTPFRFDPLFQMQQTSISPSIPISQLKSKSKKIYQ